MTVKLLANNSSSETRSVFYCPNSPEFIIWDLNSTTSLELILAITTIACPVTVLLNLLVIIAVTTRRELKTNSNILLCSLAVADLLVGAVSMSLTITLDALVLQRFLFEDIICTIHITSVFVMYTVYSASFLHLLVIAWERYVATVKWMKYKVIVTKERVKKCTGFTWFSALLIVVPGMVMEIVNVRYEAILVVDVILTIFWVGCFLFILYFYVEVYLGVRKQNRTQVRSVNALIRAKLETKVAFTTFWITLAVCISGVPTNLFYLLRGTWPLLRNGSMFRWAETTLQLNSLVNPLLYFYRNPRFRKAALELLRCRKPQEIQQVARTVCYIRRRRYSVASLDAEDLQIGQTRPRLIRSLSYGDVICSDAVQGTSNLTVKERPISAPPKLANVKVLTQQWNKVVITVQIENAPRKKRIQRNAESVPKHTTRTTELKRSQHQITRQMARSKSLNETDSFVTLTDCHRNSAEVKLRRPKSVPALSTNFNSSNNKLIVTGFINKKVPAWNS